MPRDGERTLVDDGRRRLEAIGSLRAGAAELLHLRHAEQLDAVEPLCVHVPDLAVNARCLVAAAHRALPVLALFESLEDYVEFVDLADGRPDRSLAVGVPLLTLTLHRRPSSLRRKSRDRGDHTDVVPRVTRVDSDGTTSTGDCSDLVVMAACCRGLAAFLRRHGSPLVDNGVVRPVTVVSAPVVHVDVYRGPDPNEAWLS